jgi:hypothetical protein
MLLRNQKATLVAVLILSAALISCSRSSSSSSTAIPRTADGKPDLSGIWQVRNSAAADLEDHVARFEMPAGKGVVQGGPIPYQDWAAKKKIENARNRQTLDPLENCYLPGVPRIMYMEFPFQIFQTPDHIAMTFEWSQVHRTIYTNGSPALEGIDFWMGDSRGRWEGDTLVVETRGFRDDLWIDTWGSPMSAAAKMTERISRPTFGRLEIELTIDDPKNYTRPFTVQLAQNFAPDTELIDEFCLENEKSYERMIRSRGK